ncbi:Hypp7754 [Branchiostoma lanceolatum]|uniref:Hypp7754 protein n=1 Tax=Branchiostoma lanceolatum TaxID=7740 RepID=A0A8J9Z3Q6_BRALA|nr:Hypp7754 [Branchiostoma lanceolatum]
MAARKKRGRKKNGRPHRAGQFRKGQKPWNKGLDLMQVKAISSYRRPTEDQEGLYVNKDRAGNILQNDTETLNEVGRTMVLRPTKLAGSRIARFLGKKVDSDEVEGYRIWHAKTAVRACARAQRDHDKHQPDCEGLVRLSFKGEIKKGLATVETLVCDTCKYASPKRKFYTEAKRPGPGAKIAVPNLAVQIAMFNSPIGVRVLREMAAALDLPVPSKSGLQRMANRYSDLMVKKNEDDMETWRETIYDIHLQKGNPPGSGIPAEIDTRYQTPLRSARGKKPGQPSPNSVTSLAENVTPKKLALAVHVRNKICPTRNLNEGRGKPVPAHKCPANIPEEAVIGDEKQAARDVAKKMLSGRRKTPVGQLVEDGDSSSSKGFKEVMMEETGQKVTAFKDIVHLGKGVRNRVTTTKWSKEMFPGQDQLERNRVRDRFGNDLCKRLNTEHKLARKRFPQKKKMAAKMKQVMEAIPYCYAGDHDRCVAGSLVCRHPRKWKFKDLPAKARENITPSSADLKLLQKIMEHRLGKTALKKTRCGRTTNKVESLNRQIGKACPKNVLRSRTFAGRVASAVHSSNNGTGMSIAQKRAAANIPLSPNSAVVSGLEGMDREQKYQRAYKMEVPNKIRQQAKTTTRFAAYDIRKEQGTYKSKVVTGKSKGKGKGRGKGKAVRKNTEHSYSRDAEEESPDTYSSDEE